MSVPPTAEELQRLQKALQQAQAEAQQLSAALADSWEELTLLHDLAESLRGVLDVNKAARLALEQAMEIANVEGAGILLKSMDGKWVVRLTLCPPERDEWLRTGLSQKVAEESLRRRRGFIVNDLWSHPQWGGAAKAFQVHNLIVVPLNPDGQAKGALMVWNRLKGDFTAGELKLLSTVASPTGGVIENAYLFQELQDMFNGIVSSLATVVDARSRWTAGHSHRVTRYALWLGKGIGLSGDYLEKVRLSGLLHDVGKIGIPDTILDKPTNLTDEEWVVMKQHPEIGYRILSHIKQFHGDILDGVLYHHERVDGGGYPKGLKGEEIPFMGRLLAVADGFDAMTSDRPYRPGISKEEALSLIAEGAGRQWDEELALAFVELMRERSLLREEGGEAAS